MRALTVRQPWANLIASGEKGIEIRSWRTDYRGPLVICAAKTYDADAADLLDVSIEPRGVVVAEVTLHDVRPLRERDLFAAVAVGNIDCVGLFAWVLRKPRLIEQRPVRGQLGLFTL